ncbi:MAG: hypothetical protein PF541_07590 [Prolixibacteraceae bacterium]|jgi:hypothetical protein|nr:hypothetical protein [Prolixibacteraceae bacterium]
MILLRTNAKHIIIIILFPLLFLSNKGYSQDQVGIYVCGLTMHIPGDKNASLMPLKLDKNGLFVINIGAALQYRKQLKGRWSIDLIQTFQADCALKKSYGTGISIGYDFIKSKKQRLTFAVGPGLFIRKSWFVLDGYLPVEYLKESANKKWEYTILPIVPHFEYAFYPKNKNLGISTYCIFDPINVIANFGFGVNYKLKN